MTTRSIHDMCEETATADDETPLSCMRSHGHVDPLPGDPTRRLHRDVSEGYAWTDVAAPLLEEVARPSFLSES